MPENKHRIILPLLQVATACLFAGRAWQHLFWDVPYRELFWDQNIMQPVIETLTSMSWQEYVTSMSIDEAIHRFTTGIGVFFAICAITTLFIRRLPALFRIFLWAGAFLLFCLALLYTKESFNHLGQFFEYTIQFSTPVFLLLVLKNGSLTDRLLWWMKIAIALTFSCHGLYAMGYYPRPGLFLEMTMRILGVQETGAIHFLNTAAALDFVVAVGIFLPWKWTKWIVLYAAAWGLATSLARIFGNFYWDFPVSSLHQWTHEAVMRLPHFFIPLVVFLRRLGD